jgi:hypothetical protein
MTKEFAPILCRIWKTTRTTQLVLAAAAACIAFGGIYGFAASLGMSTGGLGATSGIVGPCGTGMTFEYSTAFYPGSSEYAVNRIDLSNIPAGCLGKSLTANFYTGDDKSSGSAVSATLPASGKTDSISIDPSSNMIDAARVSGVSVVVS